MYSPSFLLSNSAAAGAVVVEWNVAQPSGVSAGAGMWDSHIRYATARRQILI